MILGIYRLLYHWKFLFYFWSMLSFFALSLGMIKLLYIVGFPLRSWKEPSEVGLCCSHVNATEVGWESLDFFRSNNCHGQKMTTIMVRPFLQNVSEPSEPGFPKPNGPHANWVYHIILDSRGWGTCGPSRLLHIMDSTIRTVEFVLGFKFLFN
jgi:hypothetical protein